jgi:membrane protease YdiL (CAAX protease family)
MLSPRAWKLESVLRLLMVLFFGLAVVGLVGTLAERLAGGPADEARRGLITLVSTVVFQVVALGVVGWFLREHQTTWRAAFGLGGGRWSWRLLLVIGATVTIFPISLVLMWVSQKLMLWVSLEVVAQPTVRALQTATSMEQRLLFGAMAILLAPVVEEVVFRGILYPAIKELGYPRLALWLTAVVFALTHANVVTFLSLTFFALALTSLYEHTESLWVPIGAHSLFNLANFAWLLLEG